MKNPLKEKDLKEIIMILNVKASDIVRTTEKEFKENNLNQIIDDEKRILSAIEKYPKIMQRPIILHNGRGVIGRPPENINKLL
jgi:arsenate reductase